MAGARAGHVSAAWLASDAAAWQRRAMREQPEVDDEDANGLSMQMLELGESQLQNLQRITWDELQDAR